MLGVWLTACSLFSGSDPTDEAPVTVSQPTATTNAVLPQTTPDLTIPQPITDTGRTLTVWLPSDLAPMGEETAVLIQQINSYATAQIDLDINIEYKAISGQGSILNYLRTGKTVAPGILPDLVALPTSQLETAVTDELIFPLNDLIDPSTLDALYPPAQTFALKDEQILGYPFALTGLTHLAYDSSVISQTIGTTWETFRTDLALQFAFPANGFEGATMILQLYLDAGGTLVNEAGQVELQVEPLARSLEQLNLARNENILVRQSGTLTTIEDSWQLGQSGTANIVLTNAGYYLQNRIEAQTTAFAPVPAIDNLSTPLISGWAWAMSTSNQTQRTLAADLLNHLTTAEIMAEWSLQTGHLPARQDAFALWPTTEDAYITFLQQQLNLARPHPLSRTSNVITALENAAFNVVTLTETPQVAAEQAAASIRP
ncbi:MAG: extracellular solute-binding protein [Chloroflexi bacterium]|nr:extracellular solute-binding protein [Chloroflexota bacterium]